MSRRFIANPPLPIKIGFLAKHLGDTLVSLWEIVWQILVPFESSPENVEDLPDPKVGIVIDESQVKQSQWIFDQAEKRRSHLEQKAQSSFGLMVFLVPLLGSVFAFIINKTTAGEGVLHSVIIALLALSSILLLLGFVSAVRAVSVKKMETLFVRSVVDDEGQFRPYEKHFHARGLLYCAAMNEAMNDHIAQFVKGAHILTAWSVITLVVTTIPTGLVLFALPSTSAESKIVGSVETKIVGSVDVTSPDLRAIQNDLAHLKEDIGKFLTENRAAINELKGFRAQLTTVDKKLTKLQKEIDHVKSERGELPNAKH